MPLDNDTSPDEIGRVVGDLIKAAQIGPDVAAFIRAVNDEFASLNAWQRDQEETFDLAVPVPPPDSSASAQARGQSHGRGMASERPTDASFGNDDRSGAMLAADVGASLLVIGAQVGRAMQSFLEEELPSLSLVAEELQGTGEPLPETRRRAVNALRQTVRAFGELARDQGRIVQEQLEQLAESLLPSQPPPPSRTDSRRWRAARVKSDSWGDSADALSAQDGVANQDAPKSAAADPYRTYRDDLVLLGKTIRTWVEGTDPNLQDMLRWQFDTQHTKYFRSMTIIACFRARGYAEAALPKKILVAAQLVEMFHNATLIIDDIVDRSPMRRRRETLHIKFDELTAYMVAGYIIADGYEIMARDLNPEDDFPVDRTAINANPAYPRDIDGRRSLYRKGSRFLTGPELARLDNTSDARFEIRLFSELLKRLAVAECVQWKTRSRAGLGLADWGYLAREDTGSMFEICACLGARTNRLRRFGRLLGMIYHGCDDVEDLREYLEHTDNDGKSLGGGGEQDIKDGILTLPVAAAVDDTNGKRVRKIFESNSHDARRKERVREWIVARLEQSEEARPWSDTVWLNTLKKHLKELPMLIAPDNAEAQRLESLRTVLKESLPRAHDQLDELERAALAELEANRNYLPGIDQLRALVAHTRALAKRPPGGRSGQ